jgi:ABC-type nitrate/sulfonate/bicarbonate transport system permease component
MAVVVPLMAPVLLVARRHRRAVSSLAYDRALAASGYLFVLSLYIGLVISAPAELRETPTGGAAPLVEFLYSLPPVAAAVPPLLAIAFGYAMHRRLR